MAGTAVTFNSNDLQTANVITSTIRHESTGDIRLSLYELANANGSKVSSLFHSKKVIRLTGKIVDTGIVALDSRLDTFRSYFSGIDKNLDIGYNSGTRRYICTAKSIAISRDGGLNSADFDVELVATEPYGKDTSTTTALNATARTLALYNDAYTFLGSAPLQQPVVTITYTAITGGTNGTVSFGNSGTGQTLSITRTWVATDVLIIDTSLKKVTVNGIEVDFAGAFPEFEPGLRTMTYNDTLTTRTFNYNIVYYKRYL